MTISVPRRIHNPETAAKRSSGARKRRATRERNPGELITLGFINPQKGVTPVKTKKKKTARRAKNPTSISRPHKHHTAKRKTRRAKNPQVFGGAISKPLDMLKAGMFALLGFVASRQLPQLALKDKNTGAIGYLSNLGVALGTGYGAGRFISKPAGVAVGIGGALYMVSRILNEQFSPVGNYLKLAGVGDAQAAPSMGRLRTAYFPFPVVRNANGDPVIPSEIDARAAMAAMQPAPPAAPLAGVNRMSGGNRLAA